MEVSLILAIYLTPIYGKRFSEYIPAANLLNFQKTAIIGIALSVLIVLRYISDVECGWLRLMLKIHLFKRFLSIFFGTAIIF